MKFKFNKYNVVIFALVILFSVSFVFAVSDPGIFGHQSAEINWTMSFCSGGLAMIGITDLGVAACGPSTISSLAANDSSPAQAVFVDNDGDVGIGTITPGAKLEVAGSVKVSGDLRISSGNGKGVRFWDSDNYKIFMTNNNIYSYGDATDYYIVNKMSAGIGRGFVWTYGNVPSMSLNANSGNLKIKGELRATKYYGDGSALTGISAGTDNQALGVSGNTVTLTNGGSITVPYAANSGTLGGLGLHAGVNNLANKIVRTDGNGYLMAGWINTVSGNRGTVAPIRIYASNDAYIRYYTPTNFATVMKSYQQKRVTGTCAVGSSIRAISEDGAVTCEVAGGGLGSLDCLYLHDTSPPCPIEYIQTGQRHESSDGHRNYVCCRIV